MARRRPEVLKPGANLPQNLPEPTRRRLAAPWRRTMTADRMRTPVAERVQDVKPHGRPAASVRDGEAVPANGFSLGDWTFDAGQQRLTRNGRSRPLNPKVASVLEQLAAAAPDLVSRGELMHRTWPDVVVGEHVLEEAIGRLRKALGDQARNPTYIETLPKRGYRLMVPVHDLGERSAPRRISVRWLAWLGAAAVSLTLTALWWTAAPPAPSPRSVVVLPFSAPEPRGLLGSYAEGLAQELTQRLASYPELETIVSAQAESGDSGLASYALRGAIQRLPDGIRVRLYLVRTADGHAVWSAAYTDPEPVAPGQRASLTAPILRMQVVRDEQCRTVRRKARNLQAAELVCAAQAMTYRINQRGGFDPARLHAYGKRAVELDPSLEEAHQIQPLAYYFLGLFGEVPKAEASRLAHQAIDRAFAIDPDDALTFLLLGMIEAHMDLRYADARRHLQQAIALDPLHPNARLFHGSLALLARQQGNLPDMLKHFRRAIDINDADGRIQAEYAEALHFAGDHHGAIKAARSAERLGSYALSAWYGGRARVRAHLALGEVDAANRAIDAYLITAEPTWQPYAASLLALVGRYPEARIALAAIEAQARPQRYPLAMAYLGLDQPDQAAKQLALGIEQRDPILLGRLRLDPALDPLRESTHWRGLMQSLERQEQCCGSQVLGHGRSSF